MYYLCMDVHNIVADGTLHKSIDRDGMLDYLKNNTDYKISKEDTTKSAVVVNMGEEYDDVVIYKGGSYAIKSGSKSSLFTTHKKFVDCMLELDIMNEPPEFSTNNIVATHKSKFDDINLPELAMKYPLKMEYEPSQYPAVIYAPDDKDYSVNIYSTGTLSICATDFDALDRCVDVTEELVESVEIETDYEYDEDYELSAEKKERLKRMIREEN